VAKILVVDDEVDIVTMMVEFLSEQNHTVYPAYDGPEAIQKAVEVIPDLILLDINMPTMDGIEVCQILRAKPETQLTPIVIVTGQTDDATLMEAIKAGCDDFLHKPHNIPVLQARVDSLLKMSRMRNQIREKERFEYMINHMRDALVITDREGIIQQCNAAAAQIFMLGAGPYPREPFLDIIDRSFRRKALDWNEILEKKHGEFILYRQEQDFKLRYAVNLRYDTLVNPFSEVEEIVFVGKEETERLNDEFRKDLLVTMLTHKFNTMEAITQLNLDALKILIDSPNPTHETAVIDGLKESSRRLTTLMKSLLDFLNLPESIRRERREIVTESRLIEVLERVKQDLLRPDLPVQLEWEKLASFEMVENGIYRILYELIENAVKFGDRPDPGIVVTVQGGTNGDLTLSVFNRGGRLPQEELNRIWDRFYQFDPDFTGQVEGIGLGLSVVKYIVELSGGTARIYSSRNGTTVALRFPADKMNMVQ
jgi:CheY-like chemotaxis protein/two-component sensor histidine kinase